MARPVSDKRAKKVFKEIPYGQWWRMLDKAMRDTGMYSFIMRDRNLVEMLDRVETAVLNDYPGIIQKNKDLFMYRSRVMVARHILLEDNNALVKWTSKDQRRFWNINIVKEQFLKYGPDALPSHFKHAEKHGGIFRWSPTANINVIMLLRGTGKSHTDVVVRSIHDFIRNPDYKALIGHSEESKAAELIKRISDALFHPNLMVAFPEFFVDDVDMYRARGTEIKKDSINMRVLDFNDLFRVMDPTDYMRGEKTFNLFTPNIDPTGQHVNIIKIDDWGTKKTTASAERQLDMIETFNSFSGLEEYTYDENGNSVPIKIQVTDTAWWGPSFIKYIIDNKDCNVFICPMSWDEDAHADPFDHKYRIDPRVDNTFIARKKDEMKEWFRSQCYMIERQRDENIKLSDNKFDFMFAYADENNVSPEIKKIPFERDQLHETGAVILSKDPAYSKKNKMDNDDKSRDATVRIVFKDNVFYVTGAKSDFGNDTVEGQVKPFVELSSMYKPDFFVMDSRATQVFVSNTVFDYIKEHVFPDDYEIQYILYTKAKDSDTQKKAMVIQSVLSVLFTSASIMVHWSLVDVVNQILRVNGGFDFLDAIVQAISINRATLDNVAYIKEMDKVAMLRKHNVKNNLQKQNKNNIIFRTTGY